MPARAGTLHADLADAAGGAVYARVSRGAREDDLSGTLQESRRLAAEVTVTAVERLGVDAAIIFADILLILEPLGIELEFAKGEGPVIHNPVRKPSDVGRLRELEDPEHPGICLRSDPANASCAQTRYSFDWFLRSAIHARLIPDRRRRIEELPSHEAIDVRRRGRVARDDVVDLESAREVSERADRGGSAGGAVV